VLFPATVAVPTGTGPAGAGFSSERSSLLASCGWSDRTSRCSGGGEVAAQRSCPLDEGGASMVKMLCTALTGECTAGATVGVSRPALALTEPPLAVAAPGSCRHRGPMRVSRVRRSCGCRSGPCRFPASTPCSCNAVSLPFVRIAQNSHRTCSSMTRAAGRARVMLRLGSQRARSGRHRTTKGGTRRATADGETREAGRSRRQRAYQRSAPDATNGRAVRPREPRRASGCEHVSRREER